MAKIAKPNSAKKRKGTPPKNEETSQNLTKVSNQDLVALNFKIPADFKKQFKRYAFEHDISMVELFVRSFEAYKLNQ